MAPPPGPLSFAVFKTNHLRPTSAHRPPEEPECAICFEEYDKEDHISMRIHLKDCQHVFCLSCLNNMFSRRKQQDAVNCCPLCRAKWFMAEYVSPQAQLQAQMHQMRHDPAALSHFRAQLQATWNESEVEDIPNGMFRYAPDRIHGIGQFHDRRYVVGLQAPNPSRTIAQAATARPSGRAMRSNTNEEVHSQTLRGPINDDGVVNELACSSHEPLIPTPPSHPRRQRRQRYDCPPPPPNLLMMERPQSLDTPIPPLQFTSLQNLTTSQEADLIAAARRRQQGEMSGIPSVVNQLFSVFNDPDTETGQPAHTYQIENDHQQAVSDGRKDSIAREQAMQQSRLDLRQAEVEAHERRLNARETMIVNREHRGQEQERVLGKRDIALTKKERDTELQREAKSKGLQEKETALAARKEKLDQEADAQVKRETSTIQALRAKQEYVERRENRTLRRESMIPQSIRNREEILRQREDSLSSRLDAAFQEREQACRAKEEEIVTTESRLKESNETQRARWMEEVHEQIQDLKGREISIEQRESVLAKREQDMLGQQVEQSQLRNRESVLASREHDLDRQQAAAKQRAEDKASALAAREAMLEERAAALDLRESLICRYEVD